MHPLHRAWPSNLWPERLHGPLFPLTSSLHMKNAQLVLFLPCPILPMLIFFICWSKAARVITRYSTSDMQGSPSLRTHRWRPATKHSGEYLEAPMPVQSQWSVSDHCHSSSLSERLEFVVAAAWPPWCLHNHSETVRSACAIITREAELTG